MLRKWRSLVPAVVLTLLTASAALAAPPVRIAVVPGGGSGQEQTAVDGISDALQGNANVALSTVNPDWYVVCNVLEQPDQAAGTVKVNGTVTIKTVDGQVIDTVSVQTNKSDFSLSPGAPLNKQLVQNAVMEVLQGMAQRAIGPIEKAVTIEIATRDRIISAQQLADQDQYDEAIGLLLPITPDTTHFRAVRSLIAEYQMEKASFEAYKAGEAAARKKQYSQAIRSMGAVNPKSKRYKKARAKAGEYRAEMARLARLAKNKA